MASLAGAREPVQRIAVEVTFLRMDAPPRDEPFALPKASVVQRLARCSVPFYRYLYDTVGRDYVWWLRRTVPDAEIAALLAPWFAARPLSEIGPLFDAASLTWSVFRTFAEAARLDPDLGPENPLFSVIDQPGIGPLRVPASPIAFSATPRPDPAPAPRLGQHTEEILAEVLGLGSGQIGALMDARVVAAG